MFPGIQVPLPLQMFIDVISNTVWTRVRLPPPPQHSPIPTDLSKLGESKQVRKIKGSISGVTGFDKQQVGITESITSINDKVFGIFNNELKAAA